MNWQRFSKVISVAVALTLLVLALTPVEVFAKHIAIVTNVPLGTKVSTLTTFTLSVTNDATVPGGKEIENVELVVDANWTVSATGDQPTPPTNWTIDVTGNTITWTAAAGSEIALGSTLDFNWKATTAASVQYSSHTWTTTDIIAAIDTGTFNTVLSDWDSYQDDCSTQSDTFDDFDTEHVVCMKGGGFANTTVYRVIFWDALGSNVQLSEPQSDGSGNLSASHTLVETDNAGDWHVAVYTATASPSSYDPNDAEMVADDTSYTGGYSFTVVQSAIPEFPTIFAAIIVAALCSGIYWWMRKRRMAYVKA